MSSKQIRNVMPNSQNFENYWKMFTWNPRRPVIIFDRNIRLQLQSFKIKLISFRRQRTGRKADCLSQTHLHSLDMSLITIHYHRSDKEKQKFQAEVFELLSQVDAVTKEKITIAKNVEKLEHTVSESHIRIEELSRQVNEVTAQRVRLSTENAELIKEVHEYKILLDNSNHTKTQLATQLEESRRRLEDEERVSISRLSNNNINISMTVAVNVFFCY